MSIALILLFILYEFFDRPSQDFLSINIINIIDKRDYKIISLSLENNSTKNTKGLLLLLLGLEASEIKENATYYQFKNFSLFNSTTIILSPSERKKLDFNISSKFLNNTKRFVFIYDKDLSDNSINNYDYLALRRERTVWVQVWIDLRS